MEKLKKETLINIIIFILFAVLTFIVGIHHEPWADEAQAWLIARDCTIPEMIVHVLKYEGHPLLWFVILRFLNFLHFPYSSLFVAAWGAVCVGVYLILFKSKLPPIIKYLFPFSYFIFYQSAVVARNHSLVFPFLAAIAVFYRKRLEHPYIYSLLLVLTASISAYSFVIAFVLLCFFIVDIIRKKSCYLKSLIPPFLVIVSMMLTALYLIKPADYNYSFGINLMRLNPFRILYIVTRGYFNTPPISLTLLVQMLLTIFLYICSAKTFCKTKCQLVFFSITNLILAFAVTALVCKPWHAAYFIITLIFTCWIITGENENETYQFKQNKCFYILLAFILLVHINWSWKCSVFDMKNNYSASKDVAEFIKENNLQGKEIYGMGYKTVALQPYFSTNLYKNYQNKAYWQWNKAFYREQEAVNLQDKQVIIMDMQAYDSYFPKLITKLQEPYNTYFFNGSLFAKGKPEEEESFMLLIQK